MTNEGKGKWQQKIPRSGSRDAFFWWAKTGSNWFRSEHHLKEQGDAQMIVSADAGGYMIMKRKVKKEKDLTARST